MTFEEVKNSIETENVKSTPLIFSYKDNSFVPHQYIDAIAKITKKEIEYYDTLDELNNNSFDIFSDDNIADNIKCVCIDELNYLPSNFRKEQYLYIITNKYDKKIENEYKDYIVDIPKLEPWQIKDYVYSTTEGVDTKKLDWLIDISNNDIYRLDNEISKLKLIPKGARNSFFDDMVYEKSFSDLSAFQVFDLTNAVVKKDISKIKDCLIEIHNFDAEPLGIVTILYQQFKKLILVFLHPNPTEQTIGLKSNVIYAIRKNGRIYSNEQLINGFKFLTNIDKMLKTGQLEIPWLIDYVICNLLCM